MTVERGIDPRDFALLPFGGAGALHAAAMAQELGITRILAPRAAGVLSALGLAAAAPRRDVSRTVMLAGPDLRDETLAPARAALAGQACAALGVEAARVRVRHELRYAGQSFELAVDEERGAGGMGADELREAFAAVHERRYGYRGDGAAVELVNMRASAWGPQAELRPRARRGAPPLLQERTIVFEQGPLTARVLRGEPVPGEAVDGPALWASEHSTLLVPPGWSAGVDEHGSVQMWGGADD